MITETPTFAHATREFDAPEVSFEFFPPKTEKMEAQLWRALTRLAPLEPDFVSVTYGAGGSTRQRTHDTVRRIRKELDVEPAAHLTCVGASRAEVDEVARAYWDAGIRRLVALRGDAPDPESGYQPHPDGYRYADELVAGLKKIGDFEISVAAYPETHPEAPSEDADLEHLRRKFDAGATRAITQFFFETEDFLRFRDKAAAMGIDKPIVPGILPVSNFERLVKFAGMCGASVPAWLAEQFEGLDDDPDTRAMIAAAVAIEQCQWLQAEGCERFHFYTLNRAELTRGICHALGVRPCAPDADLAA